MGTPGGRRMEQGKVFCLRRLFFIAALIAFWISRKQEQTGTEHSNVYPSRKYIRRARTSVVMCLHPEASSAPGFNVDGKPSAQWSGRLDKRIADPQVEVQKRSCAALFRKRNQSKHGEETPLRYMDLTSKITGAKRIPEA